MSALALFVCLTAPAVVHAVGPLPPIAPGFSGYAAVMLGGAGRSSNLDTEQSARVSDWSQLNTTDERALGLPTFELKYGLANARTQFYTGTPAKRILDINFGFELGLRQRIGENKALRLAYLPAVLDAERWADPYLVGEPRAVTDQSSSGILIGLDHLAFSLNYAQGTVKIDDEQSGSALDAVAQSALRRDGDYHAVTLDLGLPIKKGVLLLPSLVHIQAELDGEAMSHTQTMLKVGAMFKFTHSRWILSVGGGERRYDADNPVFAQRQRDDLVSASLLYLRDSVDWWGKPGVTAMLNYKDSDANIDFLDESSLMVMAGLRWSF